MALLRYAAKFDPFLSLDCAGLGDCHLATLEGMGEWTSGEWVDLDSSNEGERIGRE